MKPLDIQQIGDELAIRYGQIEGVKNREDFGPGRNLLGDLA